MALNISGSLENNLTSLKTYQQNIISYRPNIDQLETINQVHIHRFTAWNIGNIFKTLLTYFFQIP